MIGVAGMNSCFREGLSFSDFPIPSKLPQFVPDTTPTAVLDKMTAFDQVSEVSLQGVAVAASQLDRISYGYASMFTGKLDDLE